MNKSDLFLGFYGFARGYNFEQCIDVKNSNVFIYCPDIKYENDYNDKVSVDELKKRFPEIKKPFKEDICYATTNRQAAVKNIASKCDKFFVIGSRNSSNSKRLVEVAKQSGCQDSELIHSESNIVLKDLANCSTIGISSGASAPEILVDNFINEINKHFNTSIEEVEIIKESVFFKVPAKLNQINK